MLNFGNKEFRNLQEQVLKNAQDIEALKGRENLQVVIVEELPEEGNPNYIYLVPNNDEEESNVYDEYVWLADAETYEKIGGVSIDLSNYVTLNSEQTITALKKLAANVEPETDQSSTLGASAKRFADVNTSAISNDYGALQLSSNGNVNFAFSGINRALATNRQGQDDIGTSLAPWRNLYIASTIDFGDNATITKDSSNRVVISFGGTSIIKVGSTSYIKASWLPEDNNLHDLGSSSYAWKDAYIAGNISDGINSVTVADISTKTTSSYASGTFDSSGQDTIDISGGSPEGLFIFKCGNCQAVLHLTATMVQNAELTPIYVACNFIYNGSPTAGWLSISKSGNTLTLYLGGALTHVDSGYAWTLTKTNLI